ncbi:hypothetical protein [Actinomadura rupiterrae]|uniref:hypothetical protein n=1 Tax=Actinomadura rupiterrae TaxID=559627 RepID=UPI0020A28818|nr:hypothetical protein [Actinomadura rupiterrae]MCP2341331.1 hypothetical protein [Actinomadura rupiterrae]
MAKRRYHLPDKPRNAADGVPRPVAKAVVDGVAHGVDRARPASAAPAARAVPQRPAPARAPAPPVAPPPPERPKAFEVADDLAEHPDIEEIQRSPEMARYLGLRDLFRRRFPKNRLLPFIVVTPSDQLLDLLEVFRELQGLTAVDWEVLEAGLSPAVDLPTDWRRARVHLDEFLHDPKRAQRAREVAVRERALADAHAKLAAGSDEALVHRLDGLGPLYDKIRFFERLPDGTGAKEFREEIAENKRRVGAELLRDLNAAGFADIAAFDAAVRAMRRVVRDHGVEVTLTTLKSSEGVLRADLQRYREVGVLDRLVRDLAALTRPPGPSEERTRALLADHPLLMDSPVLEAVLAVHVPDLLGDVLRQWTQTRLANIDETRARLREGPEFVFDLVHVHAEALARFGLDGTSVQARLIADNRAVPNRSVWPWLHVALLVLSFAAGPLAGIVAGARLILALQAVGYLSGAALTVKTVYDSWDRSADEQAQRVAANTGTPLTVEPVPSGQWRELIGLLISLSGLLRGAGKSLLPKPKLAAKAVQALQKGTQALGGNAATALAFRPGTQFIEAGQGVTFLHPDFPDQVFHLNADGLTRYGIVNGAPAATGRWTWAELERSGTPIVPVAQAGVPRLPRPAVPAPAPVPPPAPLPPPPPPAEPPVAPAPKVPKAPGSLGAAARLSPRTFAAEARLRAKIADLRDRLAEARRAIDRLAPRGVPEPGGAKGLLLRQADELAARLDRSDRILTSGLVGFQKGFTHEGGEEAIREAVAFLEPRLFAAENAVTRLALRGAPVPLPTAAQQLVIDGYLAKFTLLREQVAKVAAGDAAAAAARDALNKELLAIEQAAARTAHEDFLLDHLKRLAKDRRALLAQGLNATGTGARGADDAARELLGRISGSTYSDLRRALGEPKFSFGKRVRTSVKGEGAGGAGNVRAQPFEGATATWKLDDDSVIRLDVPTTDARPFAVNSQPHAARISKDGALHYDDHGIVVPADSGPAHLPVTLDQKFRDDFRAALSKDSAQ